MQYIWIVHHKQYKEAINIISSIDWYDFFFIEFEELALQGNEGERKTCQKQTLQYNLILDMESGNDKINLLR
jgi:hypothetical protein